MKRFILSLAVLTVLSFSFAFSTSNDDKKSDSKTKCPYLQQQAQSECPYSGKSSEDKLQSEAGKQCPFLNGEIKSDKNSCPYLEGMKSDNSDSKSIKQVWQEIKS
ncbi:MAG: hypothetical protein KatS3mg036_0923 [Ignavibacterium sp.]|nr:MAG: hypothetical protein KatS3mg036_0923 [Ignavibacterium sp.]